MLQTGHTPLLTLSQKIVNAGTIGRLYVVVGMPVLIGMTAVTIRQMGWRINLTESEPLGLYRMEPVQTGSLMWP